MDIRETDPRAPELRALIEANLAHGAEESPSDSDHTFGADDLAQPDIRFWAGLVDGKPMACGAYKRLSDGSAEVKSVFVAPEARGKGYAERLMAHLAEAARDEAITALVLETGSELCPGYDAARRLYERLGYYYCKAFEGYDDDPMSAFMRLPLETADQTHQ